MSDLPYPIRLLLGVVGPAGVGIIAFVQTPTAPSATQWALLAVGIGGLFLAFNRLIAIADDRLNRQDVIGYE